ncbi:MAG: hypothetical protein L3J23_04615 [Flavobacteriaceae bacterium]|nr:hypothetical protein [Flavobacteriaceae bacterium]
MEDITNNNTEEENINDGFIDAGEYGSVSRSFLFNTFYSELIKYKKIKYE